MKTLITGGNGFIGSAVKRELERFGHEVSFYDLSEGNDVMDLQNLESKIAEVDSVIHLAGILGTDKTTDNSDLARKALEVNILGGFNVVDVCTRLGKRLITLDNGNYWMANPYSASKFCINQIVKAFAISRGLNADIVRAYNVYGEGQSTKQNKFAPNWIMAALKNEPLKVYGDGTQQLDAIYVDDAARVIVDVLIHGKGNGRIYEAGTGIGYTAQHFAKIIIELCESQSTIELVEMRSGEEPNAKVVAREPYFKIWSDLKPTLLKTIEYYRSILATENNG